MKANIIIHVMPTEIDWFEKTSDSLLRNASYLNEAESKNITIDVTLNLSKELYEYSNFKIPVEFFEMKFNFIEEKLKQSFLTNFNIERANNIKGINDKRRDSIRKYANLTDIFIYLDNDMVFPDFTLAYLLNSAQSLIDSKEEYFIITPEITKFWDNSWDIITNKNYLNCPFNHRDTFNTYNLYNTVNIDDIYLEENKTRCKLAGGWLNVFSSKLLKYTDIPDSLGSYGEDDTYVMFASDIMNSFNIRVTQYIVRNLIVSEEGKYRKKVYDNFVPKIKDNQEVRQQANINLPIELENFKNKCYDYILYTK
jgi:hypothetical protein